MEQRRYEDTNLLSYGYELLRGEHISRLLRQVAFVYAIAATVWGYGLIFQHHRAIYTNPAFTGIFTIAHPIAWGVFFWLAGCLLLATAIGGRALVFLGSMMWLAGVLLGWTGGVFAYVIMSPDAELTTGAVAMYAMIFTGMWSTIRAPKPLEHEVEIYERTSDGVVVPLKPVERRTG